MTATQSITVSRYVHDILPDYQFTDLSFLFERPVLLKWEGLNLAGSIKLKAAASMVLSAEESGILQPDSIIIESSSGNLGVALSMIAANRGYKFVCVTDPRSSPSNRKLIAATGATVIVVDEKDENGGFLGTRIQAVRRYCQSDSRYVWLNQYANPLNWMAHYRTTAPAIARACPNLDVLFIGAGTTGTLMGCAHYFKEKRRAVKIVAVDSVGSVTFGGSSGPRYIPGLGTSQRPDLLDPAYIDDVVMVEERDTVTMCRRLAHRGFVVGGSTGTVLAGLASYSVGMPADASAVAISPDLGEKYVDSIYDDDWAARHFGRHFLPASAESGGLSGASATTPALQPVAPEEATIGEIRTGS